MQFYRLEQCINLYDGYRRRFVIDGRALLLIQAGGEPFLLEADCPHQGQDLTQGSVTDDGRLICPRHGLAFFLASGALCPGSNIPCRALQCYALDYDAYHIGVWL